MISLLLDLTFLNFRIDKTLPKGTVFTDLTQWKVRKAADHINSTPRANLNGKTPYQLALAKFGPDVMKALKLKCVEPDAVTLTPELLKK